MGVLHATDSRRAAAQFAYLVAGEALDCAMMVGTAPPKAQVIAGAKDGVETFMARYGNGGPPPPPPPRRRRS